MKRTSDCLPVCRVRVQRGRQRGQPILVGGQSLACLMKLAVYILDLACNAVKHCSFGKNGEFFRLGGARGVETRPGMLVMRETEVEAALWRYCKAVDRKFND